MSVVSEVLSLGAAGTGWPLLLHRQVGAVFVGRGAENLRNLCLGIPRIVPRRTHVANYICDFTFLAILKGIKIEMWNKVVVKIDGPDNGKICRRHAKKSIAEKRPVEIAAIGSASARCFSCANDRWSAIWFPWKVWQRNPCECHDQNRACRGKNQKELQGMILGNASLEKSELGTTENTKKRYFIKRCVGKRWFVGERRNG